MRSAEQAKAIAARMEGPAVAFSKTGDAQLGEWEDAVILGRYGDVPDDFAPYTSNPVVLILPLPSPIACHPAREPRYAARHA